MLIVANWKAYVEDLAKAKKLVALAKKLSRTAACEIILAPSAPFLSELTMRNRSKVAFAAQDVSVTLGGAKTGEATAAMYASSGATCAIIGHSERRSLGDTNELISEKLIHALASDLTPILCVGEDERDREGHYLSVIREEIVSALTPLTQKQRARIIIAYEPLWAIGKAAENAIQVHDLTEMMLYIRKVLSELLPGTSSSRSTILYGGSVEPGNIRELAATSNTNGFLIGHASVETETFAALVQPFL